MDLHLKPLLLSTTGRSGSTLLMKILSLHDQTVVRTVFPYEIRAAQYFYLCALEGHEYPSFSPFRYRGAEYRAILGRDAPSVGWSKNHSRTALGACGTALIEAYYRFVAEIENKPSAAYFAEKAIGSAVMSRMMEDFKEAKVIFMKRDPRDTFLSIKSFNQKRGFLAFGEEQGDEFAFARIIKHYGTTRKLARRLGARAIEVRYEDIIANKDPTLSHLFDALGLDYGDEQIRRILDEAFAENDEVKHHKTTHDVNASVGKWKRETNEEVVGLFAKYQDDLHTLGYE